MKFLLLLILAASFVPGAAVAQVSVNPAALTQLAGISVPGPAAVNEPAQHAHHHWRHVMTAVKKPRQPPLVTPVVARPGPAVPKPPAPAPPARPSPPPAAAAPPIPVDIAFAAGSATLPAGAQARLAPFCKVPGPIVINARAPADPADTSYSMRLSLARALAVRASLSACGVAAQNILPRALGAAAGGANNNTEIQAGLNP